MRIPTQAVNVACNHSSFMTKIRKLRGNNRAAERELPLFVYEYDIQANMTNIPTTRQELFNQLNFSLVGTYQDFVHIETINIDYNCMLSQLSEVLDIWWRNVSIKTIFLKFQSTSKKQKCLLI